MTPQMISRICHFEYVTDNMLRGTVYYGKRNKHKDLKQFLADRSLYRVAKIVKKEFAVLGMESDFNQFITWASQPFSDEDRLYKFVQYFEKQYPIFKGYRFQLSCKNVADLYIKTQLNKGQSIDLDNISKEDLLKGMK